MAEADMLLLPPPLLAPLRMQPLSPLMPPPLLLLPLLHANAAQAAQAAKAAVDGAVEAGRQPGALLLSGCGRRHSGHVGSCPTLWHCLNHSRMHSRWKVCGQMSSRQ